VQTLVYIVTSGFAKSQQCLISRKRIGGITSAS